MKDEDCFVTEMIKIHNNRAGEWFEVQEDPDDLGLVEISRFDSPHNCCEVLTVTPKMARLLASALIKFADQIEDSQEEVV
jgi:hypothetical protein